MIVECFEWLLTRLPSLTVLMSVLLLMRAWMLKHFSARVVYRSWLLIPFVLIAPIEWLQTSTPSGGGVFVFQYHLFATSIVSHKVNAEGANFNLFAIAWVLIASFVIALNLVKLWLLKRSFRSVAIPFPIPKNTQVVESSLVESAAVVGIWRSYLILPVDFNQFNTDRQAFIIEHESVHLKRADYRWNILRLLIKSVFWFHPLIYWVDKYVEADQELSCDQQVLQNASREKCVAYGHSILEIASNSKDWTSTTGLASRWGNYSLIKERVTMLKNIRNQTWHGGLALILATAIFLVTSQIVFAEGELEEAKPVTIVSPKYPMVAAKKGVEGFVRVSMDINEQGTPSNIKVIESEPKDVFDKAAVTALSQWKFEAENPMKNASYTLAFKVE